MLTRIVCDSCNGILRRGDIGAPIEHKTCINCVTFNSPEARLDTKERKLEKVNNPRSQDVEQALKRYKRLNVEIPFKKIEDQWCVVIELSDYYQNKFAEFGFTKEKLLDLIAEIDRLGLEEK